MSHFSLLSAFDLPWDEQRHADAAEHARTCEERAMLYGLIDGAEDDLATRRFRAFVQLDGFVYPYASLERLSVVGGFNQWLYFLDDQYDDHPTATRARSSASSNACLATSRKSKPTCARIAAR